MTGIKSDDHKLSSCEFPFVASNPKNFPVQASLHIQKVTNNRSIDIQALRHFHLFFLPLGYVPSSPVFKQHLSIAYIEDARAEEQTDASESEDQALTTKGGKKQNFTISRRMQDLGLSELQRDF